MSDRSFAQIETPRLIIRRFSMLDRGAFAAMRNTPTVARYQEWPMPYTDDEAIGFIQEMEARDPDTPGEWFQFALGLKPDDDFVGDIGLFIDRDDPTITRIGYSLCPEAEGKGLMTEALTRLLAYLFDQRAKQSIFAGLDACNERSRALLLRLGFELNSKGPGEEEEYCLLRWNSAASR